MITLIEAYEVVNEELNKLGQEIGIELAIIENELLEKDLYWVFFYNSKAFIEKNELSFALAGNSPLIVDKQFGKIYETGTAYPIDDYLKEFEENIIPHIKNQLTSN